MGDSILNISSLEQFADPLKLYFLGLQDEVCRKSKESLTPEEVKQMNENMRQRILRKTTEIGEKLSETLKVTGSDDRKTAEEKMEAARRTVSWLETFGVRLVNLIERALNWIAEKVFNVIEKVSEAFNNFYKFFFG